MLMPTTRQLAVRARAVSAAARVRRSGRMGSPAALTRRVAGFALITAHSGRLAYIAFDEFDVAILLRSTNLSCGPDRSVNKCCKKPRWVVRPAEWSTGNEHARRTRRESRSSAHPDRRAAR